MDIDLLLLLRASTANLFREAREQGIPMENPICQQLILMRCTFKAMAETLPPRHCCACGLPAEDAEEWGHKVGGPVCHDHPCAWT
jgi:hypothetical protein